MKLLRQPSKFSCLPTAFAMALDVSIDWIFKKNDYNIETKHFHIQDMIDTALLLNKAVVGIQYYPSTFIEGQSVLLLTPEQASKRMNTYLLEHKGVLTGIVPYNGKRHAVAWNNSLLYDPNGTQYELEGNFDIEWFWLVTKIKK